MEEKIIAAAAIVTTLNAIAQTVIMIAAAKPDKKGK
jgi:hypothetical protein